PTGPPPALMARRCGRPDPSRASSADIERMSRFVVTAVGADRPGIVAAVTGALMDVGGNLEDTGMAVLGGQFAMMLVVAGPESAALNDALAPIAERLDLTVSVRPIAAAGAAAGAGEEWSVTVYGGDKPGIVH